MALVDTHRAIERIIVAGLSKEIAEAIVDTINSTHDELATKSDILRLKSEIKSDMMELKSEIKGDMAKLESEIKSDMVELKSEIKGDMAKLESEIKSDIAKLESKIEVSNANMKWLTAIALLTLGILLKNTFF